MKIPKLETILFFVEQTVDPTARKSRGPGAACLACGKKVSYCGKPFSAEIACPWDFFDYVRLDDDGRLWSFTLLDSPWNEYRTSSAINRLAQEDPPTAEELDSLSDEQVSELLTRTRRLKNQAR